MWDGMVRYAKRRLVYSVADVCQRAVKNESIAPSDSHHAKRAKAGKSTKPMLKQTPLLILLTSLALAQAHPVIHYEQLDEIRAIGCQGGLPEGYSCGILVDFDLPHSSMIVSVVGGVMRQLSVAINGTIYTAVYEPLWSEMINFFTWGETLEFPHE
ncbi:MAG: hypothetical protein DMG93_20720 [Acidobacteria bacterium]|nr:MAG: hypothetical protein DMG93_20720 [Acidobacteriota bacterium]